MAGLKDIAALDGYGYVLKLIVAGIAPFVYALLFRGTVLEACVSFLIGIVYICHKRKITQAGCLSFLSILHPEWPPVL